MARCALSAVQQYVFRARHCCAPVSTYFEVIWGAAGRLHGSSDFRGLTNTRRLSRVELTLIYAVQSSTWCVVPRTRYIRVLFEVFLLLFTTREVLVRPMYDQDMLIFSHDRLHASLPSGELRM